MCGIIGCVGNMPAKKVLLAGLSKLEYRGYDSAGIALPAKDGFAVAKTTMKVAELARRVRALPEAFAGIGHTRWATHGEVTERNAHPHCCGRVALVHNGIIENDAQLREALARDGRFPVSDTDTEIAAMLIDQFYDGDPVEAIRRATSRLRGAYTFAILFEDQPGKLYAVRRQSPLAVMHVHGESLLASDVSALLTYGRCYSVPEDGDVCELSEEGIRCWNERGEQVELAEKVADWAAGAADKCGYEHYMLKEIEEQPAALKQTIDRYVRDGRVDFSVDGVDSELFEQVRRVHLLGCGTAMHAGLIGRMLLEDIAGVNADVEIASEFRDRNARVDQDGLYIFVSQSGETADTLAALRAVRKAGARYMAVVNAPGSAMERESENVVYTQAGPEISVASTKAFTTQVAVLYLIAARLAKGDLREAGLVSRLTGEMIARKERVFELAESLAPAKNMFYLGRGIDMALAQEGALKIKEISYIHAEAYAAGEMKHGVISLIEPGVPTIMLDTQPGCHEKAMLCAREIRSRGGTVILVTMDDWTVDSQSADAVLRLPGEGGALAAFPAAVCLQLLAYECARRRGLPIDQPRNLAKSVTVA